MKYTIIVDDDIKELLIRGLKVYAGGLDMSDGQEVLDIASMVEACEADVINDLTQ